MSRITWALRRGGRLGGLDMIAGLGSQQVARRNAANASAALLRRRTERELVEAYLAEQLRTRSVGIVRPVAGDAHTGTA